MPLARAPFVDGDGALDPSITDDGLHLDREGYRRLAREIELRGGELGRRLAP
jgi:lysophospholipase L1-like esterase